MRSSRGRVGESHSIARGAFAGALLFALVALGWAVLILFNGGSWWAPLHAFLAGTVLLAISGASQMFTITWSSTAPPSPTLTTTQRWLVGVGTTAVLVGVTAGWSAVVWVGAGAIVGGLVVLAGSIMGSVRRSLLRRFDLSARFYLTAFAAGIIGVTLGAILGSDSAGNGFSTIRLVHSHLNLVGLIGLTIIGTIPTLLPTTAYSRAVSGREAIAALWLGIGGVVLTLTGLWLEEMVGVGTIMVALSGGLMLTGIVVRLWDKGRRKLPFLQITAGMVWLIGWGFIDGLNILTQHQAVPFNGWTGAVVIAGIGQILVGSLAYLIPVLKGSPFTDTRPTMTNREWLPLLAANVSGISLVAGWDALSIGVVSIWVADFAVRLIRVGIFRSGGATDQTS